MENNTCCGCSRPDLPWAGRGTNLDISGCRFSLYPMDSNFVPIILGALEKTDTSAVWSQSDALSTVYRGRLPYVVDAVEGLFVNAWQPTVHMALEGQFSNMGVSDYIDRIAEVWHMAEDAGLNPTSVHYATRINGDVQAVFDYLHAVCRHMEQTVPHYILHFTLSVNSPTAE
ncbi:YkoF family thiamine/hydroxymethylpyrimidine-binding protein [Fournierella sp.]|uniref:YkoF family thiamine/hydroxymethylpyrimidine-binding protein n=1 Tax=Allofournierella sp. TaxID=1940256 RepID=UPI0025BBB363|nr:YkoF family thiamine/hydroxymethylpyrimidine-binding protein [Fournierella sp.]